MIRFLVLCFAVVYASGCGTMSASQPLSSGEHRAGVTFGGPFTTSLGPPIPIPSLVVEGRSGLDPISAFPVDINYGLNATALAFGQLGLHGGASIHLLQPDGWRPGVALTERLYVYNNYLDVTKPMETRMFWGLNQFDVTASWALSDHRIYVGGSDLVDLADPELLVSPFMGVDLRPQGRRVGFQLETRVLGINFSPEIWDISWLTLGGPPGHGLVSITASASWSLGKGSAQ